MNESLVEVEGLTRRFERNIALDGVNFQARRGLVYGLVGANGAGKTTLLRHILGLLRARSGTVRVFGLDPVRYPVKVLRQIGYLSEERELPEWMCIDELMRYNQAYYPNWDAAYARELVATFGLDARSKIKELSNGMRAQVGLIAAIAHRPDLLILDEPSSGLDTTVRQDILDAIIRTASDDGRTVVFSSHLLDEVERMSDHVTMIHQGRVVLDGPMEWVRSAYHKSEIRFATRLEGPPAIEGVLSLDGEGRAWSAIHEVPAIRFRASVALLHGELVQSREATLEEIFVARVGRSAASTVRTA
jgi:ABC-2 type transport system ATP-binding protein